MPGTLRFDSIPRLPEDWWQGTDADTVWPTWGQHVSYFWGANSGNQFLDRGKALNGGGLASDQGPSRGRAHPQYVGIDTMSASAYSLSNNDKVYSQMAAWLRAGHTLVVPVDLRAALSDQEKGKFSLGTGYGLDLPEATEIHEYLWGAIIKLIELADNVGYSTIMWTPDMSLPAGARAGSRVELADLNAIKAYLAKFKK